MNSPATPSKVPLKGLFRNGVWHCNCQPRLPALRLQVSRDTKNKGRFFYVCQKDKDKKNKCNFFLWADDAELREKGAVLSNSRSEFATPSRRSLKQTTITASVSPSQSRRGLNEKTPITSMKDLPPHPLEDDSIIILNNNSMGAANSRKGSDARGDRTPTVSSASSRTMSAGGSATPSRSTATKNKRKRTEPDDEYSDFSSGDEEQLAALTDSSSRGLGKKRDALATSTSASGTSGLFSPPVTEKPVRRVLFADSATHEAKRQRIDIGRSPSPSSTPSSSHSSSQKETGVVTDEIVSILQKSTSQIPNTVIDEVRSALGKHVAKAKGLEHGREAARRALKEAEVTIAQLRKEVAHLENTRRMDFESRRYK